MTNKTFTGLERRKIFGEDPQGNIIIPDEYASIGNGAFEYCTGLTSITLPKSVKSIEDRAFKYCTSLTNVAIPDSVTSIGSSAFCSCTSLASILIPDSVKSIGNWAFDNCTSLINVTIPDSVTSIGSYTFFNCTRLTNITIPNSITSIENWAFKYCESLKTKEANYKAFDIVNNKLLCRGYEYFPNKWSDKIDNIGLCSNGYHFCTNLFEVFDYYNGELDKDIAIYECEVGDMVLHELDSSKCATNKIKPVRRLHKDDVIRILNGEKEFTL